MQKLLQLAREHFLPAHRTPHPFEPTKQFLQNPTHLGSLRGWMGLHTPIAPTCRNVHLVMMGIVLHTCPESVVDTCEPNHETYVKLLQATEQLIETLCLCECNGNANGVVHLRFEDFQTAFKRWNAHDTYRVTRMLAMAWVDIESASRVVDIPNRQQLFQQLRQHALSTGVSSPALMAHVANHRALVISRTAAQEIALVVEAVAERLHPPTHDDAPPDTPVARERRPAAPLTMEQSIENVVKRAFWDAFVARLEEKHTVQLTLMLNELKHKLKALTPSRHDLHTSIDTAVDTSLMVQMVQHGCLDAPEFLRITDFVVEHIHRTQAPADRTRTQQWHTQWREAFQSGEHSFGRLCALFLEDAHADIDKIARALEAHNNTSNPS